MVLMFPSSTIGRVIFVVIVGLAIVGVVILGRRLLRRHH